MTRRVAVPQSSSSDTTIDVAKTDKNEKPAPKADVKTDTPANTEEGAPKPGDGPKSATSNAMPTDTAIERITIGAPPDLPTAEVPKNTVEDPTHMPGPRAIPSGDPNEPALPPGHVPPGDSRSFRRGGEFALVYRQGNAVIMRFGTVGQRGQWRVVEYPTTASASHAYAKECSRFVAEGFSDYR